MKKIILVFDNTTPKHNGKVIPLNGMVCKLSYSGNPEKNEEIVLEQEDDFRFTSEIMKDLMTPLDDYFLIRLFPKDFTDPDDEKDLQWSIKHCSVTPLTIRQLEIIDLRLKGLKYKDIANRLNLSYLTVKNHFAKIYSMLYISSFNELINWYRMYRRYYYSINNLNQ